jgi:hypothetical protein
MLTFALSYGIPARMDINACGTLLLTYAVYIPTAPR